MPLGHKYYATKKLKLWTAFQKKATERFALYLPISLNSQEAALKLDIISVNQRTLVTVLME